MQDVSVLPLWRCLERRGGPDLYITEYFRVHRDSHPEKDILRSIIEMGDKKTVIAQMIGNDPADLVRTARFIEDNSNCAGIDVNLGCPAPGVCGKLAGGALLKDHDLIRRIATELRATVKGKLTLKTRIGFESLDEFDALLKLFATLPIDGLAIHGRTVREKYQSPVHPEYIARAVSSMPYPVTANGNIVSTETAIAMLNQTGAAGLMIGRGGIRNPWLFAQIIEALSGKEVFQPTLHDLNAYLRELFEEVESDGHFDTEAQLVNRMKKFANYISSGIAGGELNQSLRRSTTSEEFLTHCADHLSSDKFFEQEPPDDGKLFCGFRELLTLNQP
tara:strand:+ start:3822 stop:4820 length:999 start_codon:yes stop_codon:yes gene_type:complete